MFRILELFRRPLPADRVDLREARARWPASTEKKVLRSWRRELSRYRRRLGDGFTIRPYPNGWPAVYRGRRCVLWPGRVYSLLGYSLGRTLALRVAPVNFAWITARVRAARVMGVVTFAITADERVVLTLRGPRSSVYSGMLHGNGGNPDRIEPVKEHQIRETIEEIRARRSEIVPGSMMFGGMTESTVPRFRGKPLLAGWLRLKVDAREIIRRVRATPIERRPTDAIDVEAIELSRKSFDAILRRKTRPMCPAGAAGLTIMGRHFFGR